MMLGVTALLERSFHTNLAFDDDLNVDAEVIYCSIWPEFTSNHKRLMLYDKSKYKAAS